MTEIQEAVTVRPSKPAGRGKMKAQPPVKADTVSDVVTAQVENVLGTTSPPMWVLGLIVVALLGSAAGIASPALGLLVVPLGLLAVLILWLKDWQAREFPGG